VRDLRCARNQDNRYADDLRAVMTDRTERISVPHG
jgi:hypothetical protein